MAGTLIYLKDSCSKQFDYQRELALNLRSSSCELFLELNRARAHIQPCKDRKNKMNRAPAKCSGSPRFESCRELRVKSFFSLIVTCWLFIVSPPPKNMFFVNTRIFGGCLALKVMFSKCVLFHGLLNLKRGWKFGQIIST